MHDSTRLMVDHLTAALTDRGVAVERFDLTTLDAGELASSLVHAGTIVLACPTVLAGPHPLAAYAAFLANALKPRTKYATVIGSYGWAGKTVEMLVGMMDKLKVEFLEPVMCKGRPRPRTWPVWTSWPRASRPGTRVWRRAAPRTSWCAARTWRGRRRRPERRGAAAPLHPAAAQALRRR